MNTVTSRTRKPKSTDEATEAAAPKSDIQMVPLAQIELDGQNHRLDGGTDADQVAELAASMKLNGQQQPVQVFEYPPQQKASSVHRYLLAFGFRRYAAAGINEWPALAAIVKPMPLKPDGSIDRLRIEQVRGIENLQRQNLNPIEECLLIQQLAASLPPQLEESGTASRDEEGRLSEAAIRYLAYGIGRTEAWVRDRLYLDRLASSVKQKVLEGKLYLIFAREIAKLADPEEQERVASMCQADPRDGHCPTTIHQVRRYVAERENSLRGVPWQLDKPFPRHKLIVGPCCACPFNSSNDKMLFQHDEQAAPQGFCLRASCFEAKRELAEKATKVAVARIVKQELPPTETSAMQVTAEFVKPARVARQAKKQIDGVQPKPQKPKLEYLQTPEYKARMALGEAERKWREDTDATFTQALKQNPGRLSALVLIGQMGRIRWGMTEKDVAQSRALLKPTVQATLAVLMQLEQKVLKQKGFDLNSILQINGRELPGPFSFRQRVIK
jgi:ParB/RepB/Spo0J family partition protein